jgi:CBS domain-containing protein
MRVAEGIRRSGVAVRSDQSVQEAAAVMESAGVGALAVIDGERLVGLVTDRDLVRRCVARGLPLDTRVDDVMTTPVVTIDTGADLHDAFAIFWTHGIRRLAVTDANRFVGMISVDDLLMNLAGDLADLARPVSAEVLFGQHDSPLPATR